MSSEWNFCASFLKRSLPRSRFLDVTNGCKGDYLRRHFAGKRVIGSAKCWLLSSQRKSSESGGATRSHAKAARERRREAGRGAARRLCEGHWHTIKKTTETFLPVQLSLLFCWRDQAAAKKAILILSARSTHRKTCYMLKLTVIIWVKIL